MSNTQLPGKIIVLYQGSCRFCRWCVRFVDRRNKDTVRFVDFASIEAAALLDTVPLEIDPLHPHTIICFDTESNQVTVGWVACLEIASRMKKLWPLVAKLLSKLPKTMGEGLYDMVSKHRGFMCWLVRCGQH